MSVVVRPAQASTNYVHEPAANTAAAITRAAGGANRHHVVSGIVASYDADPTGGSLTITDGGSDVFKVDIVAKGVYTFNFFPPLRFTANSAVVVTLAAGGGTVNGIVNVNAWVE